MPALQRSINLRGPRFYEADGKTMFVHHLDGSTQIGPREATKADKAEHAEAYGRFKLGTPPDPFKPLVHFETPGA